MTTWTFDTLAQSDFPTLEGVLAEGTAPPFSRLVGFELRGWNVLAPISKPVMKVLGFQRFAKGFFVRSEPTEGNDAALDALPYVEGYNVKVRPGTLADPWAYKPSDESPVRHGFFRVYPAGQGPRAGKHAHAVFLNYEEGSPRPGLFDGDGLRDFLVQVSPDNPDLFLGKAYMKIGPLTVVGGFFVLERLRRAAFAPQKQAA